MRSVLPGIAPDVPDAVRRAIDVGGGGLLTGPPVLALRGFDAVPYIGAFRDVAHVAPHVYGPGRTPGRALPRAVRVCGLPTVPVSRAVADTVPLLGDEACAGLLAEAVRERHVTRTALVRELRTGGHYRRPAVRRTMRALLGDGVGRFPPEARLRRIAALPGPVSWDAELWADDEVVGVADAYWPAAGVVVETVEASETARHADTLRALGLMVLRIEPRCRYSVETLHATLLGGPYGTAPVRAAVRAVPC
ncbi:hypothetical protein AB0M28_14435 [Streptomyces sp. NPDC051940]|uniref:hypothetical protein n=1 Tax=Streptomyces sp. NPDC051940 TaxID=3155675 RepID=UPI00341770C7